MAPAPGASLDDDLLLLDARVKQLKREYEQYFAGHRPREPTLTRSEVQKLIALWSQRPIQNTRQRFQLRNLCARFYAYRRHWDHVTRQIEDGSYARHVFRADLHERETRRAPPSASEPEAGGADLFERYRRAREACGQPTAGLSRASLLAVLRRHEAKILDRYACDRVRFRVVVEQGRAKLKAAPLWDGGPARSPVA